MKLLFRNFCLVLMVCMLAISAVYAIEYKDREIPLGKTPNGLTYKYRSHDDISDVMKTIIATPLEQRLSVVQNAIEKYPNEPALYMEKANVYIETSGKPISAPGEYVEAAKLAIPEVKKAIALDPNNVEYQTALADLYFSCNNYPAAKIEIEKAKNIKKTHLNVGLGCAIDVKLKNPKASLRGIPCPETLKLKD